MAPADGGGLPAPDVGPRQQTSRLSLAAMRDPI